MLGPWPIHTEPFNPKTTTWTPVWSQWLSRLVEEVNPGPGIPFAGLPVPPRVVVGETALINDSTVNTWGAVIAGGGTFLVLGFWNGVDWTVMAT